MGLFEWFKAPSEYFAVTYENEEEEMTHGPWNNWQCEDLECICHQAQESETPLPVPWQALQERKQQS